MVLDKNINQSKISRLMQDYPKGLVLLSSWLVSQGYSYELLLQYRRSGWLRSIGKGAMLKSDDPLILSGALAALQSQANIGIHLGGRSALQLHGAAHYLRLTLSEASLFALGGLKLPLWFTANQWDITPVIFRNTLFEDDGIGLADYQDAGIEMQISTPARAMLECLSLCPDGFPLVEGYELMEGLATLRPGSVQELLESCKSIKTKRLFLYFAQRAGHSWFKHIDTSRIELGNGNRSLVKGGVLVPKYKLVLPEELA